MPAQAVGSLAGGHREQHEVLLPGRPLGGLATVAVSTRAAYIASRLVRRDGNGVQLERARLDDDAKRMGAWLSEVDRVQTLAHRDRPRFRDGAMGRAVDQDRADPNPGRRTPISEMLLPVNWNVAVRPAASARST